MLVALTIFAMLSAAGVTGQPKAQGAGLGMAFVKTVAEKHGGHILVESKIGTGTTFTLQLPPSTE